MQFRSWDRATARVTPPGARRGAHPRGDERSGTSAGSLRVGPGPQAQRACGRPRTRFSAVGEAPHPIGASLSPARPRSGDATKEPLRGSLRRSAAESGADSENAALRRDAGHGRRAARSTRGGASPTGRSRGPVHLSAAILTRGERGVTMPLPSPCREAEGLLSSLRTSRIPQTGLTSPIPSPESSEELRTRPPRRMARMDAAPPEGRSRSRRPTLAGSCGPRRVVGASHLLPPRVGRREPVTTNFGRTCGASTKRRRSSGLGGGSGAPNAARPGMRAPRGRTGGTGRVKDVDRGRP